MAKESCNGCSVCCYIFEIAELEKPFCTWCVHIKPDKKGCGIYPDRPQTCINFKCLWLISQDRAGQEMPVNMRPNHSHCMFNTNPENNRHIYCHVHPSYPDSYKKPAIWAKIQELVQRGGLVELVIGKKRGRIIAGHPIVFYTEEDVEHHNERVKAEQLRQTMGFADSGS